MPEQSSQFMDALARKGQCQKKWEKCEKQKKTEKAKRRQM